jgi:hypothetical protein
LWGLQERLPLRWPTSPGTPPSPKRNYRSHYTYQGWEDLLDPATWEYLSDFDWVLRLIDFEGLRPVLAQRLGWTSAQGKKPFDPVSMFLFVSWRLTNGWTRAQALRNLRNPRYADYVQRFGLVPGDFPTEGGVRYFLTALGHNSEIEGHTISVELDHGRRVQVAIQYLNQLIAGAVALLCEAGLITPEAWEQALVCPDGMIHDAASRMRCSAVKASCYQPTSPQKPRPCPAKDKDKDGCDCTSLDCVQVCRQAPVREPQARSVWYTGSNQSSQDDSNDSSGSTAAQDGKGELHYGYRSLTLQFAEPLRRFSIVLLDDFMPANAREENPAAALLLQLSAFYPDLGLGVAAGDSAYGYYAFLHAVYQLGGKRVIDLRRHSTDDNKSQWCVRGYSDKGRPVCAFGYAFTSNGFDASRQRHKWFCARVCLNGATPLVQLDQVSYPPQECPHLYSDNSCGHIINVAETFADNSIRLVRDIPVGTPTWKRLYHRARNASEYRNSVLESWGLKRLPVYGQPRGKAFIALADVWLNLTSLARLVREACIASRTSSG